MSPPVQPEQTLSPAELARIQGNVAKMRAQGAPESDVLAYLQHEDAQSHDTMNAVNPTVTGDNMARSLAQGVSMGFGDEVAGMLHGTAARDEYRRNANTFHVAHPVIDAALKAVGMAGASAPLALLGPETFLGAKAAALMGGGFGALSGAGESDSPTLGGRLLGAGIGGATGAAGGLLGYGAAKGIGAGATAIADRLNPARAVARAAGPLVNAGKLAEVDAVAPGGASLATTAVPQAGMKLSRLNYFLRGIGASPEAGATAENNFLAQGQSLEAARKALGAQMDAITSDVPVTPDVRSAVKQAAGIIGKKAPQLPKASGGTVPVQDLRDALSRLKYIQRVAKASTNPNGAQLKDVNDAIDGIQGVLYQHSPDFAALDRQYATVKGAQSQTDKALKTVQQSRSNYGANTAYKQSAGSLGGSLPKGHGGLVTSLLDHLFLNKAGAADATARLLTTPGGPELVQSLLASAPRAASRRLPATVGAGTAATANALRGLLVPPDSTP